MTTDIVGQQYQPLTHGPTLSVIILTLVAKMMTDTVDQQ